MSTTLSSSFIVAGEVLSTSFKKTGTQTPQPDDLVTKRELDDAVSSSNPGGADQPLNTDDIVRFQKVLRTSADAPTEANELVTKEYVDTFDPGQSLDPESEPTFGKVFRSKTEPFQDTELVTKAYVDNLNGQPLDQESAPTFQRVFRISGFPFEEDTELVTKAYVDTSVANAKPACASAFTSNSQIMVAGDTINVWQTEITKGNLDIVQDGIVVSDDPSLGSVPECIQIGLTCISDVSMGFRLYLDSGGTQTQIPATSATSAESGTGGGVNQTLSSFFYEVSGPTKIIVKSTFAGQLASAYVSVSQLR